MGAKHLDDRQWPELKPITLPADDRPIAPHERREAFIQLAAQIGGWLGASAAYWAVYKAAAHYLGLHVPH